MEQNKLCLGTVQFGLKYGVNNELGRQPTQAECDAVLRAALDAGIRCFDTASAYGMAETVLGNFGLSKQCDSLQKPVRIISKLKPDCRDDEDTVLNEISESLSRLHAEKLYGYMLHRASDMRRERIMAGLLRAKECGLIDHIGVSVYEPQEAMEVVRDERLDMIQAPYNILDTRLDRIDFFPLARKRGLEVYARSAFLQGLILMEPEKAEKKVEGSGAYVKSFREIAGKYGFAPNEAAFLWSYCHPSIDYVVFGVDTVVQLEEDMSILNRAVEFSACMEELTRVLSSRDVPRKVIVPSLWRQGNGPE